MVCGTVSGDHSEGKNNAQHHLEQHSRNNTFMWDILLHGTLIGEKQSRHRHAPSNNTTKYCTRKQVCEKPGQILTPQKEKGPVAGSSVLLTLFPTVVASTGGLIIMGYIYIKYSVSVGQWQDFYFCCSSIVINAKLTTVKSVITCDCDLLHQTIGNYFLSFRDSGQISVNAGFKVTHGH